MRSIKEMDKRLDEREQEIEQLQQAKDNLQKDYQEAVDKITDLQQENKQLKELKYKFFDNCGDEESFTLEDYLEISNKLYDYEEENKQLKADKKKAHKYLKEHTMIGKCVEYYELLEILGDKE